MNDLQCWSGRNRRTTGIYRSYKHTSKTAGDVLWGDVTGYVWGQTNQPLEVPILNERQRQTYYGALNYCTQEFLVKAYDKGNSGSTIEFLKEVQQQYPRAKPCFVLGWCKRFLVDKKSKPICNRLIRTWQKTFGISPAHG